MRIGFELGPHKVVFKIFIFSECHDRVVEK